MERRKLGNSDLEISAIAFGAWAIGGWMWGGNDASDSLKALDASINEGMTTIDTASVYGFGYSEELVGKAIKGRRNKVEILTKFGMNWETSEGSFFFSSKDNDGKPVDIYRFASSRKVISDCEMSLKRLGTDYIDLFQIHWPDKSTPVNETMEALSKLISQGKIRAAGVCNYSSELLAEASEVITLASNQVPYSMVRREIETDVVPYCLKNNIGILAYSPIQRGLLSGKIKPDHKFNEGDTRPDTPYYKEPNLSQILSLTADLEKIANAKGITVSQLVLAWTIHQPGITCALAGARNASQAKENSKASDVLLSAEEINLINSRINEIKIDLTI